MALTDSLNPAQKEAVLATEGPLLVFAGAGSGKTRVLTYRIAHLIREKGVSPWQILAVTFTNKAADEMKGRVQTLLGPSGRGAWVSTFHSACVRILRQHIDRLGFSRNFVIYDGQDQERHVKAVMKELDLDFKLFPPRKFLSAIDRLKNQGLAPEQFVPNTYNIFQKRLAQVYERYQQDLKRNNGLDFGDLLHFVTVLFARCPDVLRSYQELCRYVMVDEFQDTNLIQYELVKQIAALHRNLCVVGDDDQSIYRWRGAEVGNILNFEQDFSEAKVITLEQNYRSTGNILRAASLMVSQNRLRKAKNLWTENPAGEPLAGFVAEDEVEEARYVVRRILEEAGSGPAGAGGALPKGRDFREIAVFYRVNAQSRPVEDELVRNRIPYTIVGGMKFYERREVKDILAYLKLLSNPSDGLSLRRVINSPPRGIGEKTIEKIESLARERGVSLFEGFRAGVEEGEFSAAVRGRVAEFLELMDALRHEKDTLLPSQIALDLLGRTGYLPRLREEGTEEAISRIENLEELVNVITEFEKGAEDPTLEAFLDRASLVSDVDLYEDRANRVSLMTVHCAKGLEFPVVFVVGLEEGIFPHARRGEESEDLEEERRLFYVALTRARERLFLSRARRRMTFGTGRSNLPSRFLQEIPGELIAWEGGDEVEEGTRFFLRRPRPPKRFFAREEEPAPPPWDDNAYGSRRWGEETPFQSPPPEPVSFPDGERTLAPEEPYSLRSGMRVRHPQFGEGRVRAVEGRDENQKATILFSAVGVKRLMIRYAQLEILE